MSSATNLEAVPCMLRNGDGTTGVYGLLIRPVTSSAAQQQQPQQLHGQPPPTFIMNSVVATPTTAGGVGGNANKIWAGGGGPMAAAQQQQQQPQHHPPVSGNKVLLPPVGSATTVTAAAPDATVVACSASKPVALSAHASVVASAVTPHTSSSSAAGNMFIPASTVYQYQQSRQQPSQQHQQPFPNGVSHQQPSSGQQPIATSSAASLSSPGYCWNDMSSSIHHQQASTSSYMGPQQQQQQQQQPAASSSYETYAGGDSHSSTPCYTAYPSAHHHSLAPSSVADTQNLPCNTQQHHQHLSNHNNNNHPIASSSSAAHLDLDPILDDIGTMDLARLLADSESLLAPECQQQLLDQNQQSASSQMTTLETGGGVSASCHQSSLQHDPHQQQRGINLQQQQPLNPCYSSSDQRLAIPPSCKYQTAGVHQAVVTSPQHQQHVSYPVGPQHQQLPPMPPQSQQQQLAPPPRPQLDWEQVPNENAGTPDSGIQSISGSPGRAVHISASPLHSPSNGVYGYQTSAYHYQQQQQQQPQPPQQSLVAGAAGKLPPMVPPSLLVKTFVGGGAANQFSPNSTTSSSARSSRASKTQPQTTFDDISDADTARISGGQPSASLLTATTSATVDGRGGVELEERPTSSSSSAAKIAPDNVEQRAKRRVKRRKRQAPRSRVKPPKLAVGGASQYMDMPQLTPETAGCGDQSSSRDSSPHRKQQRPTAVEFVAAANLGANVPSINTTVAESISQTTERQADKKLERVADLLPTPESHPTTSFVTPNVTLPVENNPVQASSEKLVEELLIDSDNPEALVEKLLSKMGPDKIRQFTSLVESKLKTKIVIPDNLTPLTIPTDVWRSDQSETTDGQNDVHVPDNTPPQAAPTQTKTPPDTEGNVLARLRAYRSKARKVIDPALIESVFELGSRLGQFHVDDQCYPAKYDTSSHKRQFVVDWVLLEQRQKEAMEAAKLLSLPTTAAASALSNLETEAASSDEEEETGLESEHLDEQSDARPSSDAGMVEIKENPTGGSISVRIKLGGLKQTTHSTPVTPKKPTAALPPKKRIKIVPPVEPTESGDRTVKPNDTNLPSVAPPGHKTKAKKRAKLDGKQKRKRKSYPWDRKRTSPKRKPSATPAVKDISPHSVAAEKLPPKHEQSREGEDTKDAVVVSQSEVSSPKTNELEVASPRTELKLQLETALAEVSASPVHVSNLRTTAAVQLKANSSPPRKKYLRAGLRWQAGNAEIETLQFGQFALDSLRSQKETDFLLPNNIWSEFTFMHSSQANYKKIRSNVIIDVPPPADPPIQCCCTAPKDDDVEGCGETCLNRILFTECAGDNCPCGDRCGNRRIQKHRSLSSSLERFDTATPKGLGVRTKVAVPAGAYLCEYVGEIVSGDRFLERMSGWYGDCDRHYALSYSHAGFLIDAYRCGGIARFVNHSCRPNCVIQKWNVNSQYRIVLVAQRAIDVGEELTYDYRFRSFDGGGGLRHRCLCGEPECRRRISTAVHLSSSTRRLDVVDADGNDSGPPPSSRPPSARDRLTISDRRVFLWRNWKSVRKQRFNIAPDGASPSQSQNGTSPPTTTSKESHLRLDSLIRLSFVALRSGLTLKQQSKKNTADQHLLPEKQQQSDKNLEFTANQSALTKVLLRIVKSVLEPSSKNGSLSSTKSKEMKAFLAEKPARIALKKMKSALKNGRYSEPAAFDKAFKKQLQKLSASDPTATGSSVSDSALLHQCYLRAKRTHLAQLKAAGANWETDGDDLDDVLGTPVDDDGAASNRTTVNEPKIDHGKLLTTRADLAYLDEGLTPVGDWNADCADSDTWQERAAADQDWARCVCAISEEDGDMIQCDRCGYWLHLECVTQPKESNKDYICYFCASSAGTPPLVDIVQKPQPELRLPNCTYYRTLVAADRRLQVRLNECVYVQRRIDDRYKRQLKRLHEECVKGGAATATSSPSAKKRTKQRQQSSSAHDQPDTTQSPSASPSKPVTFSRLDLRVFRVERLFVGPAGQRFVFGCYYARPHETFCEPSRLFYRNELFWTPLYDTLPLEAVVARCAVLDSGTFAKGRPRYPNLREQDVYICDFKVDKSQRLFERMTGKQRYYFNSSPYVFRAFPEKLKIVRDFTPFLLPSADKPQPKIKSITYHDEKPLSELKISVRKEQNKQKGKRLSKLVETLSKQKCAL